MSYDIAPGVAAALRGFRVPERLGFGPVTAPATYGVDRVGAERREALLAIQERRAPDPFGWTRDVAAARAAAPWARAATG